MTQQEVSQGLSHSLPYHHTQGFPPGLGSLLRARGANPLSLGLPRPMKSFLEHYSSLEQELWGQAACLFFNLEQVS